MRNLSSIANAMVADLSDDLKADLNEWAIAQLTGKVKEKLGAKVKRKLAKDYPAPSVLEAWWLGKLISGHMLPGRGWVELPVAELTDDYIENCRRYKVTRRGACTAMGRFLKKVCPEIHISSRKAGVVIESARYKPCTDNEVQKRVRFYYFPNLEHCRATWDDKFGARDWDADSMAQEEGCAA